MKRMLTLFFACTMLAFTEGQDQKPILPPGPAPGPAGGTAWLAEALLVQANMIEGGEVMFMVPLGEADPRKPVPVPAVFAKVDGKAVRAFGVDRKPLGIPELNKRLALRAAALVVAGQPPDPFFLKVLHERAVVFVVPKKLYDQMAAIAGMEPLPGWWTVMKAGVPTDEHWSIGDGKITIRRGDKIERNMKYTIDASAYPKTIDLTPADGKTLKGIYELDGNTLKISYVSPNLKRPTEIGTKDATTIEFGRVAP